MGIDTLFNLMSLRVYHLSAQKAREKKPDLRGIWATEGALGRPIQASSPRPSCSQPFSQSLEITCDGAQYDISADQWEESEVQPSLLDLDFEPNTVEIYDTTLFDKFALLFDFWAFPLQEEVMLPEEAPAPERDDDFDEADRFIDSMES